jgi:photosystem II stability/assembly factor-like uncharacterized protein
MTMRTLHLGTRKGLFTIRDGALERVSFLGTPVTAVLPRDGSLWAAVGHGHFGAKLHRSRDGGATWEEVAAPKWPPKPADADDRDPMRGTPWPWSLDQIWTLESDPRGEDALWCGTIPGGLFHSPDGGASWRLIRSLWDRPERKQWFGGGYDFAGIHSICVDPRDPRRVLAGVSIGGAWRTDDGGESWSVSSQGMVNVYMPPDRREDPVAQDPHRIVQCAGAPEVFWCQHHNGVFRSTDGARRWSEVIIKPSSFGFAVAVHPRDGDTAWFVPAIKDEQRVPVEGALVVTRTRDGGKSFETLRSGLPQKDAYHLIYRHGLTVADDARTLAMGSTTGALWVSGDSGDSWSAWSRDLPPVYCVRFGGV